MILKKILIKILKNINKNQNSQFMESLLSLLNVQDSQQKLQHLKYINSFSKRETFIRKPNKNKQRLIPLTKAIKKDMMNFNNSQSSTSISEKPINYNTISITNLVRGEVQNILQELSISEQFIRKEQIDDLIEKCLKDKITIIQDNNDANHNQMILSNFDINQEFEITVEEFPTEDRDKNMLIVENMQILEQRITNLEERLSVFLQNITKSKHISAKDVKINRNALKEELSKMRDKIEKLQKEKQTSKTESNDNIKNNYNFYDQLYYAEREYTLNLLNFKKSLESLQLNQKPKLNPYVKPANTIFQGPKEKPKQRPMFLATN